MCDYCEKQKTMMERDTVDGGMIQWCGEVKASDLHNFEHRNGVFIDTRGYLRMVDLEDCNCLDAGKKIKINFCPMCGKEIKQEC